MFSRISFLRLYSPIQALAAAMKLSISLQLLDLGQPAGFLGRVISSSQGLYLSTNAEKCTHNTDTTPPCPEWDLNPRSRRPRERRQSADITLIKYNYVSFYLSFVNPFWYITIGYVNCQ
jgi:hypothetical protein